MVCLVCGSSVAPFDLVCPTCGVVLADDYLPQGSLLRDYVLGSKLGQGGFGITYRASSATQQVAIKEFFPEGSYRVKGMVQPPSGISVLEFAALKVKFLEEMRVLKQFMGAANHPNIVDVFEIFEANDTAYMVMELLEGETLEARILKLGKIKANVVRDIAEQLCAALETIHQAGLLHRDVKPANVFLTTDGRVVLIDFGSARNFKAGQTMRHTRMVTPGYAPLEQYANEARVSAATDVYALSATLHHALTGIVPPTAVERMNGVVLAPLNPQLSSSLRDTIVAGLSLQVADRPADAMAFAALALQKQMSGYKPVPSVVKGAAQIAATHNPEIVAFGLLTILLLGLWLGFGWVPWLGFIETVLAGAVQIALLLLVSWVYTWVLEFPLSSFTRLRRPVGLLRRLFISVLAFVLGFGLLGLLGLSEFDAGIFAFFGMVVFTYLMLFRAYKFPTQASDLAQHHFWDGFWLLVIGGLLNATGIWRL